MKSLRTNRPSPRAPDPEQRSQARPRQKIAKPATRDARKSTRVDDKIRKRMSMRYADNLDYTAGVAIPEVPSLPTGRTVREAPVKDQVRDDPRAVDVNFLQKDDFDPDTCMCMALCAYNECANTLKTSSSSSQTRAKPKPGHYKHLCRQARLQQQLTCKEISSRSELLVIKHPRRSNWVIVMRSLLQSPRRLAL